MGKDSIRVSALCFAVLFSSLLLRRFVSVSFGDIAPQLWAGYAPAVRLPTGGMIRQANSQVDHVRDGGLLLSKQAPPFETRAGLLTNTEGDCHEFRVVVGCPS